MKNNDFKFYLAKFLIVFICILLVILITFMLKPISTFLYLIVVIIVIWTFYKIYKDHSIYGNKIFKLKSDVTYDILGLISKDIEKIETYQKIINRDNKIIVINKAGVFEIVLFNEKGYIRGNIKDKIWYFDDKKIDNPFSIKDKYKHNYIIVTGICIFKTDVSLVTKSNIYYEILKKLNKEVYDNKKIDEIYEVLNGNN